MSMPSTNEANQAKQQPNDGRDAKGRFTLGNRGGPGNPFARQVAGLRQALLNCVTPDDMQDVAQKLLALAKEGNLQAIRMLFLYTIGKPQVAPEPDRLDIEEWQGFQETAGMKAEAPALSNVPEPEFHLNFVRNARPIVTQIMQNQIADIANAPVETAEQRQQREDAEAAECERILNAPAPPFPDVDPRYDRPSPHGAKRRAKGAPPSANGDIGAPEPSTNGKAPLPHPSTNGRFEVD